jgi:hypothetical protein
MILHFEILQIMIDSSMQRLRRRLPMKITPILHLRDKDLLILNQLLEETTTVVTQIKTQTNGRNNVDNLAQTG